MSKFQSAPAEMKPQIEADRKILKEALKDFKDYYMHFRCSKQFGRRFKVQCSPADCDAIKAAIALIKHRLTLSVRVNGSRVNATDI